MGATYRYGFNGKENDNEIKGEGNQQDYGMRIYDPRVGRFLSVDPLAQEYPWYTPYQFAGNTPVQARDRDGAEEELTQFASASMQKASMQMAKAWDIPRSTVSATKPNWGARWKNWNDSKPTLHTVAILSRLAYGVLNDTKITTTTFIDGKNHAYGIDNGGVTSYKERVGAGLSTLWLITPIGIEGKLEESVAAELTEELPATRSSYANWGSETIGDGIRMGEQPFSEVANLKNKALRQQGLSDFPAGDKFKQEWVEADGTKYQVRAHPAQENAPLGSNSRNGPTFRIGKKEPIPVGQTQGTGQQWLDPLGIWHKESDLKAGVNPEAMNNTHIPIKR